MLDAWRSMVYVLKEHREAPTAVSFVTWKDAERQLILKYEEGEVLFNDGPYLQAACPWLISRRESHYARWWILVTHLSIEVCALLRRLTGRAMKGHKHASSHFAWISIQQAPESAWMTPGCSSRMLHQIIKQVARMPRLIQQWDVLVDSFPTSVKYCALNEINS